MKLKLPAILKNKYVLYAVLFFAITNVLGFLQRKDFESLTIFIAIGLLSTHFSKNMAVNLIIAMIGANVIKGSGFIREGFKEGATSTITSNSIKIDRIIKLLDKKREHIKILEKVELIDGSRSISIEPNDNFEVDFQLNYQNIYLKLFASTH